MIYASEYENIYEFDPVKRALMEMRDEFNSHQLEVCLAPAPEPRHQGHMIRVLADQNVRWYRELCARYSSTRRRNRAAHDTKIKRACTARTLDALIVGKDGGTYGPDLLSIAQKRAGNEPF